MRTMSNPSPSIGTRAKTVQAWDHWIAFGVLGLLGVKMIYDAIAPSAPSDMARTPATPTATAART